MTPSFGSFGNAGKELSDNQSNPFTSNNDTASKPIFGSSVGFGTEVSY